MLALRSVVPRLASRVRRSAHDVASLPRLSASSLDEDQIEAFSRDGATVVRSLVPPEWVEALRAAAEANLDAPGPLCDEHAAAQGTGGRFHDDQFLYRRWPTFDEFVRRSGAGDVAARAMRSATAHIFYDQLFVKEPGTAAPTPWHNDTSYWHLAGDQIISIWVALDPVSADAGLAYVRGSHAWGLRHRVTNFSGDDHSARNVYGDADALPPVPDVSEVADADLLKWDVEPGDALLFYSAMLHGAPGIPKDSPHRRRGYATRWCGDDVRFVELPGTMNTGWKAAGFDNELAPGDPIACDLHPNVVAAKEGSG